MPPEHLDVRTTMSRDMFYYILASKLPSQKKNKNLPPDHKISEKRTLTNYFFYLALSLSFSSELKFVYDHSEKLRSVNNSKLLQIQVV